MKDSGGGGEMGEEGGRNEIWMGSTRRWQSEYRQVLDQLACSEVSVGLSQLSKVLQRACSWGPCSWRKPEPSALLLWLRALVSPVLLSLVRL